MDYIIGVDGGGSKTEAAAYRVTDGKFLNRVKTGFSILLMTKKLL